jgi:hypothetical protein
MRWLACEPGVPLFSMNGQGDKALDEDDLDTPVVWLQKVC